MRWHYRDAALLWLFPPAYLAHVVEELWAGPGFPAWFARVAGEPLPLPAFVAINTAGLVLLAAGVAAAVRREQAGWIAIAIATVATVNALLHILGSMVTGTYSPGLITSIVVYLPLGQLLLIRAMYQVEPARVARGMLAGVAIHAAVSLLAVGLARL